jgi:hypothetical protein
VDGEIRPANGISCHHRKRIRAASAAITAVNQIKVVKNLIMRVFKLAAISFKFAYTKAQ